MVALHLPSLQSKAEQADYVIGAALFLMAALLLFSAIDWLRERTPVKMTTPASAPTGEFDVTHGQWARVGVLAAMAAIACLSIPPAIAMGRARPLPRGLQPFLEQIGSYRRERTWNESGDGVTVVYMWAQYAPAGGGTPVAIGVSPVADWHNPLVCCHLEVRRRDAAVWQGQMTAGTAKAPIGAQFGVVQRRGDADAGDIDALQRRELRGVRDQAEAFRLRLQPSQVLGSDGEAGAGDAHPAEGRECGSERSAGRRAQRAVGPGGSVSRRGGPGPADAAFRPMSAGFCGAPARRPSGRP